MNPCLKVQDDVGELTLTYEEACRYHGRDFQGGVALAFKALELAFRELSPGGPPRRDGLRLILGLDPPGLLDAFEFVTRAVTRKRTIIDPTIGLGPKSVFGSYYVEVHYQGRRLAMVLRDGVLPEGFTELAARCLAGVADETERETWTRHKREMGRTLSAAKPDDILRVLD